MSSSFNKECFTRFWQYVVDHCRNPENGRIVLSGPKKILMKKIAAEEKKTLGYINNRYYGDYAPNLHLLDIDDETKLDLYTEFHIPVEKKFLIKMKRRIDIIVDEKRRVVKERILQIKVEENETEEPSVTTERSQSEFSDEDDASIWDFVIKNIRDPVTGELRKWEATRSRFNLMTGIDRSSASIFSRFKEVLVKNVMTTQYSDETKISLLWALDIPIDKQIAEVLEKSYDMLIDSKKILKKFTKKEPKSVQNNIENEHLLMEIEEEHWEFMLKKSEFEVVSWKNVDFWDDFCKKFELKWNPSDLCEHFQTTVVPNLHKTKLSRKMKVSLYCALQLPINLDYLKKLRERAFVRVRDEVYLQKYVTMRKDALEESDTEQQSQDVSATDTTLEELDTADVVYFSEATRRSGYKMVGDPKLGDSPQAKKPRTEIELIDLEAEGDVPEGAISVSALGYLSALHELVVKMKIPQLLNSQNQLEAVIRAMETSDKSVPVNSIQTLLESYIPFHAE